MIIILNNYNTQYYYNYYDFKDYFNKKFIYYFL